MLSLACGVLLGVAPAGARAWAADRAREALGIRLQAERAILQEERADRPELAAAMRELLSGLLTEHLMTQDESIALDTIDAAFVQEELAALQAPEEPGVAWALEVFVGPGPGHEQGVRDAVRDLAKFHRGPGTGMAQYAVPATWEVGFPDRPMERRLEGLAKAYEAYLQSHDADFEARLNAAADHASRGLERAAANGLKDGPGLAGPPGLVNRASDAARDAVTGPGSGPPESVPGQGPPDTPPGATPPTPDPGSPTPPDPGPPGGSPPGQGQGQGQGRGRSN